MKRSIEWSTLLLIFMCYGLWLIAGLAWMTDLWWIGLVVLPVVCAFHTSLQHETIHDHPTKYRLLNEILVSLPVAVTFPYRRYRDLHLKHHDDANLTDPYEDPESYFWPLQDYTLMRPLMKKLFRFNNTLFGRLTIGPALTIYGFLRTEIARLRRGEQGVGCAWLLHVLGLSALTFIVTVVFAMPFWVYAAVVIYPAMSLISLRSYAEHQAAENVGGRTAIVETNPALALLYLNNNLHIVHHANPHEPWYDLPGIYRERREQFLNANGHTLFKGYGEITRRFAFSIKQPVDHPYMYRDHVAADSSS